MIAGVGRFKGGAGRFSDGARLGWEALEPPEGPSTIVGRFGGVGRGPSPLDGLWLGTRGRLSSRGVVNGRDSITVGRGLATAGWVVAALLGRFRGGGVEMGDWPRTTRLAGGVDAVGGLARLGFEGGESAAVEVAERGGLGLVRLVRAGRRSPTGTRGRFPKLGAGPGTTGRRLVRGVLGRLALALVLVLVLLLAAVGRLVGVAGDERSVATARLEASSRHERGPRRSESAMAPTVRRPS